MLCILIQVLSRAYAKGRKSVNDFKFGTFVDRFPSDTLASMVMKKLILKLLWTLGENWPKLFFKLFDCQIKPMLTYGAEAWGLIADHTVIERVHLFAIKRLLNISAKTPCALVYGQAGRYPLYIQQYTKCIKYWLKVTRMTEDKIPFKAYKMLCILHCKDKNTTFASHFTNTVLDMYGRIKV